MGKSIGDFLTFSYKLQESSVIRYFFMKNNEGNDDVKPQDRTLYVVNVPQYFTDKSLKYIFSNFGAIERIYLHSRPTSNKDSSSTSKFTRQESDLGSKVAYVVFYKPVSIKKVFKHKEVAIVPRDKYDENVGKNKWSQQYNNSFVNAQELQLEINTFMAEFDKKLEEEKQKEKNMIGDPDKEGWITVSKYSKKPKIPRIERVNKKLLAKQAAAQNKLTLLKFYKNQLRNAKMEQIIELRKKFEKDKAKIALMRQNRKFKPI